MTRRARESLPQVLDIIPFRVTLSDRSYIEWDIHEGLYRVAYYQRKVAKEHDLRSAIAVAMKKQPYSPIVDIVMSYLEERDEYVNSLGPKEMVQ